MELRGAALSEPSSRARAQVQLRDGRDGSVSLIAPPRESKVSGRVLDPQGEPLPGVTLLVAPERFGVALRTEGTPTVTDAQGSFVCEGLGAGPHRLFVDAPGYATAERGLTAPGTAEIRLERGSVPSAQSGSAERGGRVESEP